MHRQSDNIRSTQSCSDGGPRAANGPAGESIHRNRRSATCPRDTADTRTDVSVARIPVSTLVGYRIGRRHSTALPASRDWSDISRRRRVTPSKRRDSDAQHERWSGLCALNQMNFPRVGGQTSDRQRWPSRSLGDSERFYSKPRAFMHGRFRSALRNERIWFLIGMRDEYAN
jgi:hypothetical protein